MIFRADLNALVHYLVSDTGHTRILRVPGGQFSVVQSSTASVLSAEDIAMARDPASDFRQRVETLAAMTDEQLAALGVTWSVTIVPGNHPLVSENPQDPIRPHPTADRLYGIAEHVAQDFPDVRWGVVPLLCPPWAVLRL